MKVRVEKAPVGVRERDPLTLDEKLHAARALNVALYGITQGRPVELNVARALGAKDSAHDVFFVQTPEKDALGKKAIFACKRFRRLESAKHEVGGLCEAVSRGFAALQPVGEDGIFPIGNLGFFVVTEHVPRFTTMNYLGWRDAYAGQEGYERRIASPLRQIGRFAAQMHSAGIVHGDFQAKNIAQNLTGQFVLFDMEDSVFENPQGVNDIDFISRAGDDLEVLVSSLVSRGYLWNSTDVTFEKEITTNLLDPYLDNLALTNTSIVDYAHHAVEEALTKRPMLHNDFAQRMGLPS